MELAEREIVKQRRGEKWRNREEKEAEQAERAEAAQLAYRR